MKLDNFDIMTLILTCVSYFARYLSLQNNDLFSPMQCIINFFKGNSWFLEIFDLQVDYSQTIVLIIIGPITSTQGRPSPLRPWCIFPVFQTSLYFRKIFRLCGKFWKFYLFPKRFSSAQISDDFFLVIDHKFQISLPIFPVSVHCPLLFRENYYFALLFKISPPCFRKIHLLFTYFMCISFPPYFDHDAFMHHPMHVGPTSMAVSSVQLYWSTMGTLAGWDLINNRRFPPGPRNGYRRACRCAPDHSNWQCRSLHDEALQATVYIIFC